MPNALRANTTSDIVIGTNSANTITVNSGSTTYSNNELIKLKDNTVASNRVQCNDVGATHLMNINTTNGNERMYLPLKYTEIGNVASGGVQIGDGTNAGATNIYGIVSLKNATDSTDYTSTNCSNVAGGLSVYKALKWVELLQQLILCQLVLFKGFASTGNIQAYANTTYVGAIIASGAISGTTITGTGNLTVGTNNMTCGNVICSNNVSCLGVTSSGAISGTTITGTGALTGTNTVTCGTINSSGAIN